MNWIAENKNRDKIEFIHDLIRNIVKNTNYEDKAEVRLKSRIVRGLLMWREQLYREGKQ
jgi:hypothetical protein